MDPAGQASGAFALHGQTLACLPACRAPTLFRRKTKSVTSPCSSGTRFSIPRSTCSTKSATEKMRVQWRLSGEVPLLSSDERARGVTRRGTEWVRAEGQGCEPRAVLLAPTALSPPQLCAAVTRCHTLLSQPVPGESHHVRKASTGLVPPGRPPCVPPAVLPATLFCLGSFPAGPQSQCTHSPFCHPVTPVLPECGFFFSGSLAPT